MPSSCDSEVVRNSYNGMWPNATPEEKEAGRERPDAVEQGGGIGGGKDRRRQQEWPNLRERAAVAEPRSREGGVVVGGK